MLQTNYLDNNKIKYSINEVFSNYEIKWYFKNTFLKRSVYIYDGLKHNFKFQNSHCQTTKIRLQL